MLHPDYRPNRPHWKVCSSGDNVGGMLIDYHRRMLADRPRNNAFHKALKAVVVRGKSMVADIGSGTGILGFMAARLGAKHVYAFEQSAVMDLAVAMARDNKIKNITFVPEHSTAVDGLPQMDVIVSETLGNYAFEEQMIETIEDAKRFLKPGGVIIPSSVTHMVAPVITDRVHRELCVWDDVGFDLDFARARDVTLNNIFVRTFKKADLLAAREWDNVDFSRKNSPNRKGTVSWVLDNAATIYGFAVWWNCTLVPKVTLSTAPDAPKTHWEQLYLPVLKPVMAKRGDKITFTIAAHSSYQAGTNIKWTIDHNGTRQSMNLDKGFIG